MLKDLAGLTRDIEQLKIDLQQFSPGKLKLFYKVQWELETIIFNQLLEALKQDVAKAYQRTGLDETEQFNMDKLLDIFRDSRPRILAYVCKQKSTSSGSNSNFKAALANWIIDNRLEFATSFHENLQNFLISDDPDSKKKSQRRFPAKFIEQISSPPEKAKKNKSPSTSPRLTSPPTSPRRTPAGLVRSLSSVWKKDEEKTNEPRETLSNQGLSNEK